MAVDNLTDLVLYVVAVVVVFELFIVADVNLHFQQVLERAH